MVLDKFKQKISDAKNRLGSDNLGPDRGTMDQLEARKERARQQARKQAKKEKRQEALADEREKARKQVDMGVSDDDSFLKRGAAAVASAADRVDLDGDGTPLDEELSDDGAGFGGDPFGESDGGLFDDPDATGLASGPFDGASGSEMGPFSGDEPTDEGELRAAVGENSLGISQNDNEIDALEDELDALQAETDRDDPFDDGFGGGF